MDLAPRQRFQRIRTIAEAAQLQHGGIRQFIGPAQRLLDQRRREAHHARGLVHLRPGLGHVFLVNCGQGGILRQLEHFIPEGKVLPVAHQRVQIVRVGKADQDIEETATSLGRAINEVDIARRKGNDRPAPEPFSDGVEFRLVYCHF